MSDSNDKAYESNCKSCGKHFFLKQKDVDWYKSMNYAMPRKCFECRGKARAEKKVELTPTAPNSNSKIQN